MPNVRAKNKVFLGGYVEKELKRRLVTMAKEAGMGHDRFGFVMSLISRPLAQRRKKHGLVSARPKAAVARP